MAKKTAGNKKRARGKSTLKDLEPTARKAKGVRGGRALGAYTPILVTAKN